MISQIYMFCFLAQTTITQLNIESSYIKRILPNSCSKIVNFFILKLPVLILTICYSPW